MLAMQRVSKAGKVGTWGCMSVLSVAQWGSRSWELADLPKHKHAQILGGSAQRVGTGRLETRASYAAYRGNS